MTALGIQNVITITMGDKSRHAEASTSTQNTHWLVCLRFIATDLNAVFRAQFSNTMSHGFKIIYHNQILASKPFKQVGLGKLPVAVGKRDMFRIRGTGYG